MAPAYESKFPNIHALVERYVNARVIADVTLSLTIEQEVHAYLCANTDTDAQDEQQFQRTAFVAIVTQCDTALGPLGSLDIWVLDPI